MTTYTTERLQPGLDLLDAAYPQWEARIDLERLDMASWRNCIAGQLCGGYERLALPFAFDERPDLAAAFNADHPSEARLLTEAWARVITERRLRAGEREAVAV